MRLGLRVRVGVRVRVRATATATARARVRASRLFSIGRRSASVGEWKPRCATMLLGQLTELDII